MVALIGDKAMNRVVSHLDGVHASVGDVARRVKGNATARLAIHQKTGAAHVTISDGKVDWFVNLEDEAAMSIEFGHWVEGKYKTDKPKYVQGLYILSRAAGLV